MTDVTLFNTTPQTPEEWADFMAANSQTLAALKQTVDQVTVPRTWKDVTASRALGTVYTNSSNREIQVNVRMNAGSAGGTIQATLNGTVVLQGSGASDTAAYISFLVPNNTTYQITNNVAGGTILSWCELS